MILEKGGENKTFKFAYVHAFRYKNFIPGQKLRVWQGGRTDLRNRDWWACPQISKLLGGGSLPQPKIFGGQIFPKRYYPQFLLFIAFLGNHFSENC